jgi:dihydroxyacetone kinase DhaKLM complex PTS-EIIA-like component DhaM
MATLVFDIETSALPLENFDGAQQEYLFREAEKIDDAIAKNARREEITKFMSLWPFTSQVVCIAMLNAETQRGQTLVRRGGFRRSRRGKCAGQIHSLRG